MPTVLPIAQDRPEPGAAAGRKLTGLHVLAYLLLFFGTVASVNAVMIHYALSTFRGEVVAHPYEQGLAYNAAIKEARDQEARGWKVEGAVTRDATGEAHVEVSAHDASGAALTGLQVHAILAAPADMKRDRPLQLDDAGGGVYRGAIPAQAGVWDLELTAARDGKTLFQSRNRVTLR